MDAEALKGGDTVMNVRGELVIIDAPTTLPGYFEVFDLAVDHASHN